MKRATEGVGEGSLNGTGAGVILEPIPTKPCPARRVSGWIPILLAMVLLEGCSVRKLAVSKMADALAGGGGTFASDDDPDLIRAAIPFSLKLMESLLAESPSHKGLLLATASGFTQYGFAFVQQDAEQIEENDLDAAIALRARAKRLYLRARNYGLRGLEATHPGFGKALKENPGRAAGLARKGDVALLYWTASAWAAAISISKDQELLGDLPAVEALIDRGLTLDESFGNGSIHSFLISYEMVRQGATGEPWQRARKHFDRAVELSQGGQAGPYVAYAESVSIPREDRAEFEKLLGQALAIDPDKRPEWRLANLIYQRRARWLLDRVDKLILGSTNDPSGN